MEPSIAQPPLQLHIARHKVRADIEGLLCEVIVTAGGLPVFEEGAEDTIDVPLVDTIIPLAGLLELISSEEATGILVRKSFLQAERATRARCSPYEGLILYA